MSYFSNLLALLQIEKEEDRRSYQQQTASLSVNARRENGMSWYPIAIRDTEIGRGDYLTVEVERTTHQDIMHQLRFGMSAALFSNHDPRNDRLEGTIAHISGNRLKIALRVDELPDWTRNGKLGIDSVFDENSYSEMETALRQAPLLAEKNAEGRLIRILTGSLEPDTDERHFPIRVPGLNEKQEEAVNLILSAQDLAIVHGPPGTGKTTTLVHAIRALFKQHAKQILVVAPSNAAVDLLSERLSEQGVNVVRVGNPAKVSERQLALTLDHKMTAHPQMKEIRRLRKQASEFRDMAQKYKRNFGRDEREQRKALFTEARNVLKEVERTEQYIVDDVLGSAEVITATLVGSNHYTVRSRRYETVVIDEGGQALEPACWIPVLKAHKLVIAGDHCQLPPTIKSQQAAREGLASTLMEKLVKRYPKMVVLLEEQYRMHESIMGFSSREFYEGHLKAHESVKQRNLFGGDEPLLFIDTAGCGFEEKSEGTSISNPEEAAFVIKQVTRLVDALEHRSLEHSFPSIAVISPYRHQVELLKEEVRAAPALQARLNVINVNTIDSFQGQERDVVFISLTRSNSDNSIGFLSEVRRMNVAMTRAKKKLVVIGDSATISQFPFYADFVQYAEQLNGYRSAWEFMD